jgi:hypothetical protein
VFLGNGEALWAEGFRDQYAPGQRVLSDPKRAAYRQLKMKKGSGSVFNRNSLKYGARALKKGFIQGKTQGAAAQQGGVVILGPGDVVHYVYRSEVAGDHPDPSEVLAAIPQTTP